MSARRARRYARSSTSDSIRVQLVVQVRLYALGLEMGLDGVDGIEVIGSTSGLRELEKMGPADVVIVDAGTCFDTGVLRRVVRASPERSVLAIGLTSTEDIITGIEEGIGGVCSLDASFDELCDAVHSVVVGGFPCPPHIARCLAEEVRRRPMSSLAPRKLLTEREAEILKLIEEGLSNKEIARSLFIEVSTVKNHVHRILGKLGVRRRGEAAAVFRRNGPDGLVDEAPPADAAERARRRA